MEYKIDFDRSFMSRTLSIIEDYEGPNDATLIVNCLLGLLIVPKEKLLFSKIPDTAYESLIDWGIQPKSIKSFGKCEYGHSHKPNLNQLVRRLRNSVAHFRISPIHENLKVTGFQFKDRNGFQADISLDELKTLVKKLAAHLEIGAEPGRQQVDNDECLTKSTETRPSPPLQSASSPA